MPRSNRPRTRRRSDPAPPIEHLLDRMPRSEPKRDGTWNVQPHPGTTTVKTYTCPGCGLEIPPGTAHVVAWRADGLFGEAADLAARRHWHTHCWRIRP